MLLLSLQSKAQFIFVRKKYYRISCKAIRKVVRNSDPVRSYSLGEIQPNPRPSLSRREILKRKPDRPSIEEIGRGEDLRTKIKFITCYQSLFMLGLHRVMIQSVHVQQLTVSVLYVKWFSLSLGTRSNVSQLVNLYLGSEPTSVFCYMGDFGCGFGGWTPVMKINGTEVPQFFCWFFLVRFLLFNSFCIYVCAFVEIHEAVMPPRLRNPLK